MHIADNQDALLDYLYEEGDPAERLKIARHLQECAACSVAVLELQSVRGMLSQWTPPASELGFRIVQDGPEAPRTTVHPEARSGWAWWGRTTRQGGLGWLQAAAALLLFVAGMAASQVRMEYRDGAMTLRAGSIEPAPGFRAVSITLPSESGASGVKEPGRPVPDIDGGSGVRPATTAASAEEMERLLQRVRAMIDQSEQRQQRELALRLSQVAREVDTQHQVDFARIQQSVGQQQELMDYIVRTSGVVK